MKELIYHAEFFVWRISASKDTIKTLSRHFFLCFWQKLTCPTKAGFPIHAPLLALTHVFALIASFLSPPQVDPPPATPDLQEPGALYGTDCRMLVVFLVWDKPFNFGGWCGYCATGRNGLELTQLLCNSKLDQQSPHHVAFLVFLYS